MFEIQWQGYHDHEDEFSWETQDGLLGWSAYQHHLGMLQQYCSVNGVQMGPIIAAPLIRDVMDFEPTEESNCNRTDADIDVAAAAIRALAECGDHGSGGGTEYESDGSTNSGTDIDEESEMEDGSSDESDCSEGDLDE